MPQFSPTIAPPSQVRSSPTGSITTTGPAGTATTIGAENAQQASAADQDQEETREEVVQLMRSRATQLRHYSILLLHTVLAQLARLTGISGGPEAAAEDVKETSEPGQVLSIHRAVIEVNIVPVFLHALPCRHTLQITDHTSTYLQALYRTYYARHSSQLLLYYGESTASWLELQHAASSGSILSISTALAASSAPSFAYSAANTSVGLPHVHYDVCGVLGCNGKTPQVRYTLIYV